MTTKDRINTLTANCWAAEFREHGIVDFDEAAEFIHTSDAFPGVVALLLEYLQQPERQNELAIQIAEFLADLPRERYGDEVRSILEAEQEREALWRSCRCTPEQAEADDQRLDDPRHEEARALRAGRY